MKCEICTKNEAFYHISVRLLQTPVSDGSKFNYRNRPAYGDQVLKTDVCKKCLSYKNGTIEELERVKKC